MNAVLTAPVEILLVRFPKNIFRGEITTALQKLVRNNIIKIIDLMLVTKDKHGNVTISEVADLGEEDYNAILPILSETRGILNSEDARTLSKELDNDTSAGLMLFEDTWAGEFSEAVDRAGGKVVVSERIPKKAIEELAKKAAV